MTELFSKLFNLGQTSYWLLLIWTLGAGMILCMMPKQTEMVSGQEEVRWHWVSALAMALPLILWAAYRPHVGDTTAYAQRFNNAPAAFSDIPAYISRIKKDKGFEFLIALLKCIGVPDYRTFFLIFASFQICSLVYTFRRYSSNYWISIFLFVASTDYLSWTFNGIRQFTAVCITFLAFHLLIERKYIHYCAVTLLAYTIHASSLLMIPLAFIMNGPALSRKTMLVIIGTALCIPFIDRFTPLLEMLLSDTQYGNIMSNEIWTNDDGTNIIRVLIYSVPALTVFLGYRYVIHSRNRVINLCINASVLTMAIYLISAVTSGVYIGRLPIYTTFYGYMVLPWVIDQIFERASAKLIKFLMIVLYLCFFYFQMHFSWNYL